MKKEEREKNHDEIKMGTGIVSRKKEDLNEAMRKTDYSMKKSLEGPDEKFLT